MELNRDLNDSYAYGKWAAVWIYFKINLNFIFIMKHSHIWLNIEEQMSPTRLPNPPPLLKRLLLLFSSIYLNAVIVLLFLHWPILHSIAYSLLQYIAEDLAVFTCSYITTPHSSKLVTTVSVWIVVNVQMSLTAGKSRVPLLSVPQTSTELSIRLHCSQSCGRRLFCISLPFMFGLGALFSGSLGLPFRFYFSLFSCS